MRYALTLLLALVCLPARAGVYAIGNSLTNDAAVWELDNPGYHIRGASSLPTILANPSSYAGVWPSPWNIALASTQYDFVTVQPYGGAVADNVAAISHWMAMQPNATFVVHTSWPALSQFTFMNVQAIIDHADQIMDGVRAANPGRNIYRDKAVDALLMVHNDIAAASAPFASFAELYRDDLHLTGDGANDIPTDNGEGRYLIHQVLRSALGQPLKTSIYPAITAERREYLHGVVARVTAVPETSQLVMGVVAWISAIGAAAWRRFHH